MRGIGKGQKIRLVIIPEVAKLIRTQVGREADAGRPVVPHAAKTRGPQSALRMDRRPGPAACLLAGVCLLSQVSQGEGGQPRLQQLDRHTQASQPPPPMAPPPT